MDAWRKVTAWPLAAFPLFQTALVETKADVADVITAKETAAIAHTVGFTSGSLVNAVSIAHAESEFDVDAWCLSCFPGVSEDSRGLWQINIQAHPGYDGTRLLKDPLYNARAAWDISFQGTDWRPWSTFGGINWLNFLPAARTAAGQVDDAVITDVGELAIITKPPVTLRLSPGGTALLSLPLVTSGTVLAGPVVATLASDTYPHIWWQVAWAGSVSGWVEEESIRRYYEKDPRVRISISIANQTVTLSWPANALSYVVDKTSDLNNPVWARAGVALLGLDRFVFSAPMTDQKAFYRVQALTF